MAKQVVDRDGERIKVRVGGGIIGGVKRQTVFIEKRFDDVIWLTAKQARNLAAALNEAANEADHSQEGVYTA